MPRVAGRKWGVLYATDEDMRPFWGTDGAKYHLCIEDMSVCGHHGNYIAIRAFQKGPPDENVCKNCLRILARDYPPAGA